MTRPDWTRTWLEVAGIIAKRSRCIRDQVGCVIVDSRNRIVATGYNGPPADFNPLAQVGNTQCNYFCPHASTANALCIANHAEANALMFAERSHFEGGTIYVNSETCWECAKLIANSGIRRVVNIDAGHEYRDPVRSWAHLERSGIFVQVIKP